MTDNSRRYPDPSIRVFDPPFAGIFSIPIILFLPLYVLFFGLGPASKIALGATISFFPIVLSTIAGYLLWSDIPNDRMLRWDETTGAVSTFRQTSNNANGHTRDREGRLVSCEHLTRRVTRTE